MRRSSVVAGLSLLGLAAAFAPSASRADPPEACEPSRFALFGEDSYFTSGASPDHVFFHVESRDSQPVTVTLESIDLVTSERTRRLVVGRIVDDRTGEVLGRRFVVAPNEPRRLLVYVETPVDGRSYLFRGTFREGRCTYTADSNVVFAHRTPTIIR